VSTRSQSASLVPNPASGDVLTGKRKMTRVNSQCSTRKHGRPVRHSLTWGAWCSLERR